MFARSDEVSDFITAAIASAAMASWRSEYPGRD